MSAEPIAHPAPLWYPDPKRQSEAGFTFEDILELPDDAPRVELVDGVMLVVPSPTADHQDITLLLGGWLRSRAPEGFVASTALGVAVDDINSCEPDVLIRRAGRGRSHLFQPEDVLLVVEIVSPGTRRRDRLEKPAVYADAGIPYFWRIEQDPIRIYAYKLVDDGYKEQANSDDELVVDEPFPIRLPISAITP